MVALGWIIHAPVFLDELLAMAGLAVYGWSTSARWRSAAGDPGPGPGERG